MDEIIIRGDQVELIQREVRKTVNLADFLEVNSKSTGIVIPFLPCNTKGICYSSDKATFIVEQEPRIANINYSISGTVLPFSISLPWLYYGIILELFPKKINRVFMTFSKKQVTSRESEVGFLQLPNLRKETFYGWLCLSGLYVRDALEVHQCINELTAVIFTSNFSGDYLEHFNEPMASKRTYYSSAERLGKDNSPAAEYLINANDSKVKYMYTWDQMSPKSDFLDKLVLQDPRTYGDFLKLALGE